LADNIFNVVLTRLVELFWNVDEGDTGDDYDETSGLPEDSPIKFEQLANSPKLSDDKRDNEQLLKILAANHAKEAQAALNLSLPQVAIHHLRKAAELVPLDIVIGYWLARLLVATGRRKQCLEARRIALLCARVAGIDDEHKLQAMACRIIAARASERLGEIDVALECAEAAHGDMNNHWMAKLEYGRQLALSGKEAAALGMAKEAFWLRPDLIRQIQRDEAYRGLGKAFGEFRAALKQTVLHETEQIARVGYRIRKFDQGLGVAETIEYAFDVVAEAPQQEQRTILRMINDGRASARSSLQILQKCARKLLADSACFEFGGAVGLTPEIKERILEKIRAVKLEIEDHSDQLKTTKNSAEQASEKISVLMDRAIWGGVLTFLVVALMALFVDVIIAIVTVAIIGVGGWYFWQTFQSLKAEKEKNLVLAKVADRRLTQAEARSADLDNTMSIFEAAESELQRNTKTFCELVDEFERASLRKRTFAPAVPVDRDRKGGQGPVWSNIEKAEDRGIPFELELLPPQLRLIAGPSTPKRGSDYWLALRVSSDGIEALNRSAAYFQ
jgi:tetratricopeptide (TPR) repeat protein